MTAQHQLAPRHKQDPPVPQSQHPGGITTALLQAPQHPCRTAVMLPPVSVTAIAASPHLPAPAMHSPACMCMHPRRHTLPPQHLRSHPPTTHPSWASCHTTSATALTGRCTTSPPSAPHTHSTTRATVLVVAVLVAVAGGCPLSRVEAVDGARMRAVRLGTQ